MVSSVSNQMIKLSFGTQAGVASINYSGYLVCSGCTIKTKSGRGVNGGGRALCFGNGFIRILAQGGHSGQVSVNP